MCHGEKCEADALLGGVGDAPVPAVYAKAFAAVDPTGSGETSVSSLSRVLGTSMLPAATIDKVRCEL